MVEHWGCNNRNWVSQIDTGLRNAVFTLLLDEETETVFVGGVNKILKQFNLRNGELVKEYNNLGVNCIRSFSSFKHILCVGGNLYHFSLIDMEQSKILTNKPIKTSVYSIYTSQFLTTTTKNQVRVSLALSGRNYICLLNHNSYQLW